MFEEYIPCSGDSVTTVARRVGYVDVGIMFGDGSFGFRLIYPFPRARAEASGQS